MPLTCQPRGNLPVVDHDAFEGAVNELLHAAAVATQDSGRGAVLDAPVVLEVDADSQRLQVIRLKRRPALGQRRHQLLGAQHAVHWGE